VYALQAEIPARGTIPFAAFDQDGNASQEKVDLILFIQVPKLKPLAWR